MNRGKRGVLEVMGDPNITFVDGDEEIVSIITRMLELEGYDISAVNDGCSALALLERHEPDLRVLDIMMLEMDGYTVCQRIREFSGMPIIMVTARGNGQQKTGDAARCATGALAAEELPARVRTVLCSEQADSYLRPVFPRHALVISFASG